MGLKASKLDTVLNMLLSEETLTYWTISRSFNKHSDAGDIAVSVALTTLSCMQHRLSAQRKLLNTVSGLTQSIILTGSKRKLSKKTIKEGPQANIVEMARPVKVQRRRRQRIA